MYGAAYYGQAYYGQGYPERSIVFDRATSSGYQASLSSYSFAHIVGLSSKLLVVDVSILATGSVSTITYNGVSMTKLRADATGVYRNEIWYLVNPASGSNTVAVTLSTSLTSIASAASYGNIDQTTPIESQDVATGTGGTPTLSIVTISEYAWVMSGITTANATPSPASSQVQRANNSGALGSGAVADKGSIAVPVSTAVNWSAVGVLESWVLTGIALNPSQDKIITDTITLSDSLVKTVTLVRADTITLSDARASTVTEPKGDTITLSDAASLTLTKSFADTITLSDADIEAQLISTGDTITLTDSRTFSVTLGRSDTITLSDALSRTWTAYLSFADTITLSDARSLVPAKPLADTITLTDARTAAFSKVLADTITLSDARGLTFTLRLSDTITLTDLRSDAGTLRFADTIILSDSFVRTLTFQRTLADTITLSDGTSYVMSRYSASYLRSPVLLGSLTRQAILMNPQSETAVGMPGTNRIPIRLGDA